MGTRLGSKWLAGLLVVFLLAGAFLPRAVGSEPNPAPFCREDGYCLPPPMRIGELLAKQEAGELEPLATPAPLDCEVALLVKRAEDISPQEFRALLERQGYTQIEGLLVPRWWRVCVGAVGAAADQVGALEALPQVADAEIEGILTASFTPDDPRYPEQWGLPLVGAPQAWALTRGSTEVLISVIDTGYDATLTDWHPDRPAELWLGWDFVNNDDLPNDDHGHGTHVTGIATAAGNNGVGISGLCPQCATLAIKSLGAGGGGDYGQVANGIVYAAWVAEDFLHKRGVINLSLGGASPSSVLADAVAYARSRGSLVIAAAGNDGAGLPDYPARLPGVLAVTATNSSDSPANFSQFGGLAAPGVSILSTVPRGVADPPYQSWSGTSMAAPLVAAAAGLVWSHNPGYTPSQVRWALLRSAHVPAGWDARYGVGRLNVHGAVSLVVPLHHRFLPISHR